MQDKNTETMQLKIPIENNFTEMSPNHFYDGDVSDISLYHELYIEKEKITNISTDVLFANNIANIVSSTWKQGGDWYQ